MKWIAFLFALFIIAVIVLADMGILPRYLSVVYDFPGGDKIGHFVLFGLLNFFLTLAFSCSAQNGDQRRAALSTAFVLTLLITVEEFSQMFFSTRTFDLVDLLASYAGVAIGGFAAFRMRKRS